MPGVVVRPVEVADVEGLLDIYESVAAERRYIAGELPVDRAKRRSGWISMIEGKSPGRYLAAEVDGALVGMASVAGTSPLELGMMVAAPWRGKGVGTALLEACIEWAKESGAHKICLEVWPHNDGAIALYERYGFVREGYRRKQWRRRNGELWDSVMMGLLLVDDE
ncbi:MAG TPA: GNAT family N-acetyltransferase [Actinomycetota bacterium]|nr:GNAT family N-acetyltransferase [Actinomycetota bacterium]